MSTGIKNKYFYTARNDRVFKAIFADEKDFHLMETLLSECLDTNVKIIKYYKTELDVRSSDERTKRLDLLIEAENRKINLELNTSFSKETRVRNLNYFTAFYSEEVSRGYTYDCETEFIHIDLSFRLGSNHAVKEEYKIKSKNRSYVDNFKIVVINMDKLKRLWYDNNEEEIERYKHLMMLDLDKKELEGIKSSDEVLNVYKEKVMRLNEDLDFIRPLTPEEDELKYQRTIKANAEKEGLAKGLAKGLKKGLEQGMAEGMEKGMEKGLEQGIEQGSLNKQIEIAKNMLKENMNLKTISKITGLSIKQINELEQ